MPGKLTSFEELMLCQHTTGFPCEFFIRLRFQGHLSPERFEQAVLDAASRHPLLAAGIVFRSNRPYWSSHAQLRSSVVWCDGEDSNAARAMPALDISRQGFAIWVQRDQGCSDVWLQMHHACCDGLGGYQFVRDILLLYAHGAASLADATREAVPALPRVDAKLLSRRGGFNMSSWEFLRMLPRQLVGVLGVREYLSRRPLPLLPHRPAALESVRDVYPTVLSNQFTLPVSQRLGRLAHSESATSNELLCTVLFAALDAWQTRRGIQQEREWLRMMVPLNMRNQRDAAMPAANVVSAVFLDRRGVDIADTKGLLASLHRQMETIKNNRLGCTFLFSLAARRYAPGGIPQALQGERCHATSVFSNVGRVLTDIDLPETEDGVQCGDVLLKSTELVPPLTPQTCVAFGATWFANRLAITLHYDPRPIDRESAEELMQDVVRRVVVAAERGEF